MSNDKNFEILNKSLPEYLSEFFMELENQIYKDEERWGDTWKERGLIWEGKSQEERAFQWMNDKFINWSLNKDYSFPWLKMAGEAMIGFIREKYLKDNE